MSEDIRKEPEWLAEMKATEKKTDDPVIGALARVGDFVVDNADTVGKRIDKTAEQIDKVQRMAVKENEETRLTMEKGFKILSEKFENMRKREVILGGTTSRGNAVFSAGDALLAAMPEEKKYMIFEAERAVVPNVRNDQRISSDPVFKAMSAIWFQNATKLQLQKQYGRNASQLREELDRVERAFADIAPTQKADFAEGADATGGYLVPTIVASEILRIIQDSGKVVSRARHIPMTGDTLQIPNELTGVTVYWPGEASNLTGGENTFGVNTLTAKKIAGRASASIEVVEDAVVGLMGYIQTIMAEKIGKTLDGEALEGTGTNFTGLVTESGVNSVATTTTDGEAVTYRDLVNAVYAADESSVEDNATWFMHRKMFASIVALQDTTNQPIFQYANVPGAPYGTILGFPVVTVSALSTAISRGSNDTTANIYFGNPQRLIFGDRQTLRWDVTETGPGWEYYQVDMRLVGRFGFTVGTPAAFSKIVGGLPISQI